MISLDQLIAALESFRPKPDDQQMTTIRPPKGASLFVVAGPGTGKTTCLTLRILKLILVDEVPPRGILATTFTVKAAEELRSRILGWGFRVIDTLLKDKSQTTAEREFLETVDINQVWTGTVDSLCEQILRDFRSPGTQPPILADEFVSNTLMLREGLFGDCRHDDPNLDAFLLGLYSSNGGRYGYHTGTKVSLLRNLWERRFQDQVEWASFLRSGPKAERAARACVSEAHAAYEAGLQARQMVDFSLLENQVLERLETGQLEGFTNDLQVVLVDEYQDSNLMQERLYFALAEACQGALTVVGDDDQSLYRFRGATVDLFRDFPERYEERFGTRPRRVFLTNNYRSTDAIRSFVNDYSVLDDRYQEVRVSGKPVLSRPTPNPGLPILGMFRDSREELAAALADLVHDVFRGRGRDVAGGRLIRAPGNGDLGDCALLCSSPQEYSSGNKERLPLLLRQELEDRDPSIRVFNPRGEDFAGVPIVELLGGFLLECLDLGGVIAQRTSGIFRDVHGVFDRWREAVREFLDNGSSPPGLREYAVGWAERDPGRPGYDWPRSTPAIELIYGLVHFFPELHDDPEGQVYLETFTRQLTACEQIGKFKGRVLHHPDNEGLSEASVKELLVNFLAPIASGVVQVDEELLQSFPRDRLSVLSIHQSKGLEFPLTIVDIGSDFGGNYAAQRFKRFPDDGGVPHRMEDLLRPFAPGLEGTTLRSQVDRAFDDLYRQYFVAFSRAQDVLLLVGLNKAGPDQRVDNVAYGWRRSGVCEWSGEKRPFEEI